MSMRLFCLSLALSLSAAVNARADSVFCLKAPDGDGFYSGCTETQLPHAATPKVICVDPTNPRRFITPSPGAIQSWPRAAEGAQNWCPKASAGGGKSSPIRGEQG